MANSPKIQKLLHDLIANSSQILKRTDKNVFDKHKNGIFYCWINFHSIIDEIAFKFKFDLFIKYDQTYQYTFITDFCQIKDAHAKSLKYFPQKRIPKELMVNGKLQRKIQLMNKYMILSNKIQDSVPFEMKYNGTVITNAYKTHTCIGPSQSWFSNNERVQATTDDGTVLCFILNVLFNCPMFIKEYLPNMKNIHVHIQKLLQLTAAEFMNNMRKIAKNRLYSYPRQKCNIQNAIFISIYAVKAHKNWQLKFTGHNCLLTLQWCSQNIVLFQLLNNDCISQRIFWYSSSIQQEVIEKENFINNVEFDIAYKVKLKSETNINLICKIIDKWLVINPEYKYLNNNEHHFVRDIMYCFDKNVGKKINSQFGVFAFNKTVNMTMVNNIKKILRDNLKQIIPQQNDNSMKYQPLEETKKTDIELFDKCKYKQKNNIILDDMNLKQWLTKLNLDQCYMILTNNGYNNIDSIKNLTKDNLQNIGIILENYIEQLLLFSQYIKQKQKTDIWIQSKYKHSKNDIITLSKLIVVIICIGTYDGQEIYAGKPNKYKNANLLGAKIVKQNMKQLFKDIYNFHIIYNKDDRCTSLEFDALMQQAKDTFNNGNFEGIIIIYSGHGTQNALHFSDYSGEKRLRDGIAYKYEYRTRLEIEKYFSGDELQYSAYTFFFFDACRKNSNEKNILNLNKSIKMTTKRKNSHSFEQPDANTMIFYSNTEGYSSYDIPKEFSSSCCAEGGILVHCLFEIMMDDRIFNVSIGDIESMVKLRNKNRLIPVKNDEKTLTFHPVIIQTKTVMSTNELSRIYLAKNDEN
eukprot:353379_1